MAPAPFLLVSAGKGLAGPAGSRPPTALDGSAGTFRPSRPTSVASQIGKPCGSVLRASRTWSRRVFSASSRRRGTAVPKPLHPPDYSSAGETPRLFHLTLIPGPWSGSRPPRSSRPRLLRNKELPGVYGEHDPHVAAGVASLDEANRPGYALGPHHQRNGGGSLIYLHTDLYHPVSSAAFSSPERQATGLGREKAGLMGF